MKGFAPANNTLSAAQADYLKQILHLQEAGEKATTKALSRRLAVRPASVSGMLARLAAMGLVRYQRYRAAELTEEGYRLALELLRHHRLLETFLHRALGYGWEEVHAEAEKLEHHISEELERRIAEWLGHPSHDPHGDPIPTAELRLPEAGPIRALTTLSAGEEGVAARVSSQDRDTLTLFGRLGIMPGAHLQVVEQTPEGVRVRVGGQQYLLPGSLAHAVWVGNAPP